MEPLVLAQLNKNTSLTKEKKSELLKKVGIHYCIPDKKEFQEFAGYTSLHYAVQIKNTDDLAIELLELGSDPTKLSTKRKQTPLHLAIASKSILNKSGKLARYILIDNLLSKQVELNNTSNPMCKQGISHFHIACIVNQTEAVEFFIGAKVDLEQVVNSDSKYLPGYTALHCAIKYSSVEAADILIRHGADIYAKNAEGTSCSHLLLQRLVDINDIIKMRIFSDGNLCMPWEEEIERLESIVKLILKTQAKDGTFVDDTGLSALHLAAALQDKSFLKDLLEKNVYDVNMSVKSDSKLWPGWTPVHFAACCNIETMILMMQNGGNKMMKNLDGETALDLCAKRFTPAHIELLLSKENTYKNIMLSDNCTKLSDLLLAMNNYEKFSDFLQKLEDINIIIPVCSQIWPGYGLLHLCMSMNEKRKNLENSKEKLDISQSPDSPLKCYNCTEDKEVLYYKRIDLCLRYNCSVDVKNANEQTPIHLAFSKIREITLKQLLNCSKKNVADDNGLSHLHIACATGHLDSVKTYLSGGSDVNSRARISFDWREKHNEAFFEVGGPKNIRPNSTPLHLAVVFGHENVVKYLLEKNANVYAQDSLGFTPIHLVMDTYLFMRNNISKLLFDAVTDMHDSVSSLGLSHLHVAVRTHNAEAVDELLFNGANLDQVINADAKQFPFLDGYAGCTPLFMAGSKIGGKLLKAGANVYAKNLEGVSALQLALRSVYSPLSTHLIRMVKKGKCEIEFCGLTLLHVACKSCDIKWARKLIKKGADVNARMSKDKGDFQDATPLHVLISMACLDEVNHQGIINFVKLLLENGANSTREFCGSTPLHLIHRQLCGDLIYDPGDADDMHVLSRAADILLTTIKSYDVNPVDNQGFSYFHFACVRNNVEFATKFLDHGVDVNAPTSPFADENAGFTPLHFAMAYGNKEVINLLLERGADVNAEDATGNKPLHIAIKREFVDLAFFETMIRHGADINAKNMRGETLFYCLLGYGGLTLEGLEFFFNCGCSINILNATNDFREGIIGLAMRSAEPTELQSILEKLMQFSEVQNAIQNGFNIIQSIVAIRENDDFENHDDETRLTLDNYLSAIKMALNIGCDINQQDRSGKTALHAAVNYINLDAIKALLQLGADINVADNENICPALSEKIIKSVLNDDDPRWNVVKAIACHAWKMRCIELEMKPSNLKCLESVEERFSLVGLLEQSCLDELTKAKETEICQGLTVRNFLSEMGAVAEYPKMGSIRRGIVDNFFEDDVSIRCEFPEFCGLLAYQYRKALARMDLWQQAKDVVALVCPIEPPDLCLEAILRYFTNDEMKLLIESENELMCLFDFE